MAEQFVKNREGVCPVCCDIGNLDYDSAEVGEGGVIYPWTCNCGATGDEYYDMTFSEHCNVTDKEGGEYVDGDNAVVCEICTAAFEIGAGETAQGICLDCLREKATIETAIKYAQTQDGRTDFATIEEAQEYCLEEADDFSGWLKDNFCDEDYSYEIMSLDDKVLDNDYVALDAAIEYAKANGGAIINKLFWSLDGKGRKVEIIAAEVAWDNTANARLEKAISEIDSALAEAEDCDSDEASKEYAEGYSSGLNKAKLLLQDLIEY